VSSWLSAVVLANRRAAQANGAGARGVVTTRVRFHGAVAAQVDDHALPSWGDNCSDMEALHSRSRSGPRPGPTAAGVGTLALGFSVRGPWG
jgi:hypothetical protein